MACRTGCPTQDHRTWGECARAGRLMVGYCQSVKGLDRTAEKKLGTELDMYRQAREAGIQPDGTTMAKVEFAMRQSDVHGGRYGEEFRVIPKADRKGYDPVFKKAEQAVMAEIKSQDHEVVRDAAKTMKKYTGVDL